jgi:ribosomal protein L11 methyltransferase
VKWIKFRIKTVTEAEDILISNLYDIGLEGAQIEDKIPLTALEKEQMFVDIMPDIDSDDDTAYISCFVDEEECSDPDSLLESIKEVIKETSEYTEVGEGTVEVSKTEDVDWINNWKQYFKQFYIDDLLVIPSWEEVKPEDKDKKILHIDPGTAFGTGMHETTQLCIRALKKYLTPETVMLDVGTGSGILSIVSLMYGAKYALGTDLDPCAIDACHENAEANGIDPNSFKVMIGNVIDDKKVQDEVGYEKYDIVVANILADVLKPLTPVITGMLKPGGVYIMSGIINTKEEEVKAFTEAAGLKIVNIDHLGEWVGVTAVKDK